MRLDPYDFRSPAPLAGALSRRLDQWFGEGAGRSAKAWSSHLNFPAEMKAKGHRLTPPREWLATLPSDVLGFRVTLGRPDLASLLLLPRPLVVALTEGALGETLAGPPPDRELTPVESELCPYLLRKLFLELFTATWPGARPPTLEFQGPETDPRWSRAFPADQPVLLCTFVVVTAFGELDWCWMVPRGEWLNDLLASPVAAKVAAPSSGATEALARSLPVELSVILGSAEVPLSQAEQFQPGDLILLDTWVGQPMLAQVSGEAKFRVLPGAVGARQAVRVEEVLEP